MKEKYGSDQSKSLTIISTSEKEPPNYSSPVAIFCDPLYILIKLEAERGAGIAEGKTKRQSSGPIGEDIFTSVSLKPSPKACPINPAPFAGNFGFSLVIVPCRVFMESPPLPTPSRRRLIYHRATCYSRFHRRNGRVIGQRLPVNLERNIGSPLTIPIYFTDRDFVPACRRV